MTHIIISSTLAGFINLTFHHTTSGIALVFVVIKVFHIATASVCTEPNHSDIDGAITVSQLATIFLSSSFSNPSNICIFCCHCNSWNNLSFFKTFFVLLDSIILNTKILSSIFTSSGNAFIR